MTLLLREADVQALLTMPDTVDCVESAMKAHGLAQARNMARERIKLPKGTLHILAGADLSAKSGGYVGVKAYTSFREGNRFLTLLYSADNGRLLAIIESDYLGMMRTGAASGVATKYLARADADVLAIFGSGWQARGQVLAVAAVRTLKQVRVFSRDAARRQKFAEELGKETSVETVACESPAEALEGALIVATATTARDPVFPSDAVADGTHINAAGSNALIRREIDERLVRRAGLVAVDSRAQAREEAGDLLIPAERGWLDWDLVPELSSIIAGQTRGRRSDSEITIFESQGLGLQDVAAAALVYEKATAAGRGEQMTFFES
jgi:ornithine cyclodeaminase/alanine dehydrogenase-like protein (mu-crystallin family)